MAIILGIDPGSHTTGYAFILQNGNRVSVLEYGTLKAPRNGELLHRIGVIVEALTELLKLHKPEKVAMEGIFYSKNVKSALILGHIRGAIMSKCYEFGMRYQEIAPKSIKLSVTGKGSSTKDQVAFMLQKLLGLKELPSPIDASDALAVAWTSAINKES